DKEDAMPDQAHLVNVLQKRVDRPLHCTMVIGNPALCHEVELVDEQDTGREGFCQFEDQVYVLRGLTEVLGGDHREANLEEGKVEFPGECQGKGGLAGARGAHEEELAHLVDAVPAEDIPVRSCNLDLPDDVLLRSRADEVVEVLLDLLGRAQYYQVHRVLQALVVREYLREPGLQEHPCVFYGGVILARLLVGYLRRFKMLKEKGQGRILLYLRHAAYLQEPARRRLERSQLYTLPELLAGDHRRLLELSAGVLDTEASPDHPLAHVQGPLHLRRAIDCKEVPAFRGQVVCVKVLVGVEEFCGEEDLYELEGLVISSHFCNFYYFSWDSLRISHAVVTRHPS